MLLIVVLCSIGIAAAYPADHDPFNPIGPWFRHKPPCGLPSFTKLLPEKEQEKIREIWASYKEGEECDKEHKDTRKVVESLSEDIRHQLFAGRCGPSFLHNVSKTIRNEFRNVWFNHQLSVEQKELQLKKLAYSLLTEKSLALFNKWVEELQVRKAEYEEKVASLSPDARDALEQWKALKYKEKEFLANLPKPIRDELKRTFCKHYGWPTNYPHFQKKIEKIEEKVESTTPVAIMETTTTKVKESTTEQSTPASTPIENSEVQEKTDKEFARFLDVNVPDGFTEEAECEAFY